MPKDPLALCVSIANATTAGVTYLAMNAGNPVMSRKSAPTGKSGDRYHCGEHPTAFRITKHRILSQPPKLTTELGKPGPVMRHAKWSETVGRKRLKNSRKNLLLRPRSLVHTCLSIMLRIKRQDPNLQRIITGK